MNALYVVITIVWFFFLVVVAAAARSEKCAKCGCRKTTMCNWEVWGDFAWSESKFDVVCANCGRFKRHVFGAGYNRDDADIMKKKYGGPFKKEQNQ